MTRRSKIARLSKEIRDDLNQKIEDGACAKDLAEWLNGQEEVQSMLLCHFKGNAITEQNLSDWRNGGYLDWQRAQESWGWMQQLADEAGELKERGFGPKISDWFGTLMSAEITSTARELIQQESDPKKRWERLCEVYKQVTRLRHDDLAATRTRLRQEKWIQDLQELLRTRKKEVWDLAPEDSDEIYRRMPDEEALYTPPLPKPGRKRARRVKPEKSSLNQINPDPETPINPA